MRIKILMLGADPISLMTDAQLLRERGLLAITAFNMDNINELVSEVRPDVVFFDPNQPGSAATDAYNNFVANEQFSKMPVIFTLAEDDIYLITRDRVAGTNERALIADNIMDAVRLALEEKRLILHKQTRKTNKSNVPAVRTAQLFA